MRRVMFPFLRASLVLLVLSPLAAGSANSADTPESISITEPFEQAGLIFQLAEIDPDADRITPLVVLLGGSEGGLWSGAMGRDLRRSGFSTLSLSYFGHEGQPLRLIERPLEPIATGLTLARQTRGATRRCMAVIGVSKGGELALLLASHGDRLAPESMPLADAFVSAAPSHVVWQAPHVTIQVRSSWSMDGEPIDFVPYPWLSARLPDVFRDRLRVGRYHEDALRNEAAVADAIIPVERIAQPTLLLAGTQDEMWPSADMARAIMERAERLNSDTPLRAEIGAFDHFVLSDADARAQVIAFVHTTLQSEALAGRCEAVIE